MIRLLTIAAILSLSATALASDSGYSTVVVSLGGSTAASTYTGTHTEASWVRAWKTEGPNSVRNVKLKQQSSNIETTYFGCRLDKDEPEHGTLTMTCSSSAVEKKL